MRRVILCLALLACHRKAAVPSAAEVAPNQVFVAKPASGVLEIANPADPPGAQFDANGQPTLIVAVPGAPIQAPPRPHPPVDALPDLLASLTPEGREVVPKPDTIPFYEVTVRLNPETGTLDSHVELDWPNTTGTPLGILPLRLFANATGPHLRVASPERTGGRAALEASKDPTVIPIKLDPPLAPGQWLHLTYQVIGRVPQSRVAASGGLAAQLLSEPARAPDYGLFATFPDGVAVADWLPMVAARFESSFDLGTPGPVGDTSFSDVANFRAAVELPSGYHLAAPGAVLSEEGLPDWFVRTRLALAAGRDLALFASKNYRTADAREGSTRVRVVFESGHATEGQLVLSAARHALSGLGQRVTPYPWTQFTAVEVPLGGGAGGAEFSGLVAIAGMFFEPKADVGMGLSFQGQFLNEMREFTVTHEVAHQWWAIQVGSHPREEPDVDEPLAQATAAMILSPAQGKRDRKQIFDRQVAINYRAMRILQGEDGPAARATSDFENTTTYAGLVYGKAPLFYESLAGTIGEDAFWAGLRTYAETYRFKTARRGDVLDGFATSMSHAKLTELFTHWFGEDHGDVDLADRGDPLALAGDLFGGANPNGDPDGMPANLDELMKSARASLTAAAQGKSDTQVGEQPLLDPKQAQELLKTLDSSLGGVADVPEQ